MAILEILTYPDLFLKQTAKPVKNIDEGLDQLISDMAQTMYTAPGVGLAAIQVGVDQRMLVYDREPESDKRILQVLINPVIVEKEGLILSENEGCLSVPDFRANVKRYESILVEGIDDQGNPVRIEHQGLPAIVVQHELDHLNGKLFIDHISALKRNLYTKRIKKQLKKK